MLAEPVDAGPGSERVAPVRTGAPAPPSPPVVEGDRTRCRGEDEAARHELFGGHTGKVGGIEGPLGHGDVAGRLDELGELRVGDRMRIQLERFDANRVDRPFVSVEPFGTHLEFSAFDTEHRGGGRHGSSLRAGVG